MREDPQARLTAGFQNWIAVLATIMVREVRTRFSGGSLGYFWAIILPVSWILAIIVFFTWVGRAAPVTTPLPVFIASGMLPYLVFRQVVTAMMRVVRANRHLVTIGPATEEDLLTAGALLELANAVLVSATVLLLISTYVPVPIPPDPLRALLALGLAWALGASVGRLAASVAVYSDTAQRLVPIVLRPFFWISGIFFLAAELPASVREALWFNPLLHIVEFGRTAVLPGFASDFADIRVPLITIAGCYFSSRLLDLGRPLRVAT